MMGRMVRVPPSPIGRILPRHAAVAVEEALTDTRVVKQLAMARRDSWQFPRHAHQRDLGNLKLNACVL
jgi:hypothetical protein